MEQVINTPRLASRLHHLSSLQIKECVVCLCFFSSYFYNEWLPSHMKRQDCLEKLAFWEQTFAISIRKYQSMYFSNAAARVKLDLQHALTVTSPTRGDSCTRHGQRSQTTTLKKFPWQTSYWSSASADVLSTEEALIICGHAAVCWQLCENTTFSMRKRFYR